jgi:hypothetical protein
MIKLTPPTQTDLKQFPNPQSTPRISPLLITENDVAETLNFTDNIIQDLGPRLAGTPSCDTSAEIIHDQLQSVCDSSKIERFSFHRETFLAFMKVFFITYLFTLPAILFGGYWLILGIASLIFGSVFALTEFVFYLTPFDKFFKKHQGTNVSGTIEPTGDVRQQIVISGHHDSAYVFNFFRKFQKLYALRIFSGLMFYFVTQILLILWGMGIHIFEYTGGFAVFMRIFWSIGFFFVLQFFFFKSNEVSPGAGDNLIATAISVKLAQRFGIAKRQNHKFLQHTRLIFASFDAEESGLRGSRAFCAKHKEMLQSMPTYNLNIESIYNVNELSFLTKDVNQSVPLSKLMAQECMTIAQDLGYKTEMGPITWGGGATDAAEFAKIGVNAVTLLGMKNTAIRDGLYYHTPEDTVDKIEPAAVRAVLEITAAYIAKKDAEVSF